MSVIDVVLDELGDALSSVGDLARVFEPAPLGGRRVYRGSVYATLGASSRSSGS
jgi:hypothetical protein